MRRVEMVDGILFLAAGLDKQKKLDIFSLRTKTGKQNHRYTTDGQCIQSLRRHWEALATALGGVCVILAASGLRRSEGGKGGSF